MFYVYRCTTDKLDLHLNRVQEAGDQVLWPVYLGGRDWLLICRKASETPLELAEAATGGEQA